MYIHVPTLDVQCPFCGKLARVDVPEPTPSLPLPATCGAQDGCGEPYQISQVTVTATLLPHDEEPTVAVQTETEKPTDF